MNWEKLAADPDFQEYWESDEVERVILESVKLLLEGDEKEVHAARGVLRTIRTLQTLPALRAEARKKEPDPGVIASLRPHIDKWLTGWLKIHHARERRDTA